MQGKQFTTQIFFALLLLLPGCAKKLTKPLRLRPLTSYLDHQSSNQGITLRVKQLSPKDCEQFLGTAAHRLFKRRHQRQPIYPMQLSITNNTHEMAALKAENISLKLADTKRVIARLQTNSIVQVFGSITAGFLATVLIAAGSVFALSASGVVLLVAGSIQALAPMAFLGGSALVAAPVFLLIGTPIASTIKGVESHRQNKILNQEIRTNTLKNSLLIDPYQTVDTLIFVEKKNYKEKFTISFTNPHDDHQRAKFFVHLKEQDL
jgi:hypothetical protein